jgi:hypothetical protein
MFAGEKIYILLEIPNNYNLQISTYKLAYTTRVHFVPHLQYIKYWINTWVNNS